MSSGESHLKIEERFGRHLRTALSARYGKLPSAAFVANQFNRRLNDSKGVSQETVRRWMRGVSMPTFAHLEVLVVWLNFQCLCCFGKPNSQDGKTCTPQPKPLEVQAISDQYLARFTKIFTSLPPETREVLAEFISSFPV